MFKLAYKYLIYAATVAAILIAVSVITPALHTPILEFLKNPLVVVSITAQEVRALVFYHRNYIQNEALKKEVAFLRYKLKASQDLYQENNRLKKLLAFKQGTPFKVIAARVIGRSPDSWSSSAIIDKGSSHGIKKSMTVITFAGLAGRVVETTPSTSKVLLVNDPNIAVSAVVKRSREEGLVSGTLGSTLSMKYLAKDSDIQPSDEVVTSGLTGTYPKGLEIGKVVEVGVEFSGLSRYAVIKPAVDLYSLEEVLVIIQ